MKKLIIPLLAVGLFALPIVANAAGPTWGASPAYFGGENTYGYSWAGQDGKSCRTTTSIGGQKWTDTEDDWAQTEGCFHKGNWNVYETHHFGPIEN